MSPYSRITGTGSYLPPRRVTNDDLAKELAARGIETSDQWIVAQTDAQADSKGTWGAFRRVHG